MNDRLELTDELLVRALRQRTDVPMPAGLLSRVMAGATGMPQVRAPRRWLAWAPQAGRQIAIPMPAIAGAAIAVAILVAVIGLRPALNVPGSSPSPAPTATSVPSTPQPSPAAPTPAAQVLGDRAALRLALGSDVAPIDVISAFDSIWIADIHANDVRRYDPATMREIARIPVSDGPAWFVEADGALWVSTQLGSGLTRIDPATNTVVAQVGADPPCGAPFLLDGAIWQAACDGDAFLRIDPVRNTVAQRYEAEGHTFLVPVGDAFYTSGPDGLARWDPVSGAFTDLPSYAGPSGALPLSDGATLWVPGATSTLRVDPADGHTLASFPYLGVVAITFDGSSAYLTEGAKGVIEVDLATNDELGVVPIVDPWVARSVGEVLWVTDFNGSSLWRVEP
jgi:hypothetical protein